jgi:hypothetical protein
VVMSVVGTPASGSSNYEAKRPLTCGDDFESLCYSLHALRMGVPQWVKTVVAVGKPTFEELLDSDPLVRAVYATVERSQWKSIILSCLGRSHL